jgi:hypothetical protein
MVCEKRIEINVRTSEGELPGAGENYIMALSNTRVFKWTKWSWTGNKRTGPKLVKIFLAYYRTQRFNTTFTTSHHLPISGANPN